MSDPQLTDMLVGEGKMHTPGPWEIVEYGDDETPNLVIHKATETRVCFMAYPGRTADPADIEADARLIAAAPDMKDAIVQIKSFALAMDESNWRDMRLHIERQCAVLAKATEPRP